MDLGKFIERQRQHTIAILSLLTGTQVNLVTKMSRLTVNDGSDLIRNFDDFDYSDDLKDQVERASCAQHYTKQLFSSQDKVD